MEIVSKIERKAEKTIRRSLPFERPFPIRPDSPAAGFKRRAFGKEQKTVRALEREVEKKVARFFGQLGSPSPNGRQVAGILKKNMRSGKFRFRRTSHWFC